jgi:hypothetical protein
MQIQVLTFNGPRSAEVVEAANRAGRDRIAPLVQSHPELRGRLLGGFRGLGPDGSECVVILAHDGDALDAMERVVMSSELLPDEDPALLSGPDRVERYTSENVFGQLADLLAGAAR